MDSVHTCTLLTDGTVRCWDCNNSGQLGDGAADYRPFPMRMVELDGGKAPQPQIFIPIIVKLGP